MLTMREAAARRGAMNGRQIRHVAAELKALESAAKTWGPGVRRLLEELGRETWGWNLLGRRYTVLGPEIRLRGVEWVVRQGQWKGDPFELANRSHEYYHVRLAFDQDGHPSYYLVQCADTLASDNLSPRALRALLSEACQIGPGRLS